MKFVTCVCQTYDYRDLPTYQTYYPEGVLL